eukprot:713137-Rhodomonas_salina.1
MGRAEREGVKGRDGLRAERREGMMHAQREEEKESYGASTGRGREGKGWGVCGERAIKEGMGSKVREEEREREGASTEREGEGWGRDDAHAKRGREGEGW